MCGERIVRKLSVQYYSRTVKEKEREYVKVPFPFVLLCINRKQSFFYIVAAIVGCGVICAGVIRFVIGESVTAIVGAVRIIVITRL